MKTASVFLPFMNGSPSGYVLLRVVLYNLSMKPEGNWRRRVLVAVAFLFFFHTLFAAAPTVSNVRASQRAGTQLVDVYYDVADADSAVLTVSIAVSTNGGASYFSSAVSVSGTLGTGITPGSNKKIIWNAGTDLPAKLFSNVRVSVTASDDLVLIPAGSFTMGDSLDGNSTALPLHNVYVSAFYMDKYEVTKALWNDVYSWAITHGYSFDNAGMGKASNHPVTQISWYDCVRWCNARSEKENLTPCYFTDAGQGTIYKTGTLNLTNSCVNWSASGYRLPTEAEWEKAARGGASGRRFPWSDADTITHNRANYNSAPSGPTGIPPYDVSPTQGYHPTFNDGVWPYTSRVGYFSANGYGLYDMAGNVWEWCWDGFNSSWYSQPGGTAADSRGPDTVAFRVRRGGTWDSTADVASCSRRSLSLPSSNGGGSPFGLVQDLGFRCVRRP